MNSTMRRNNITSIGTSSDWCVSVLLIVSKRPRKDHFGLHCHLELYGCLVLPGILHQLWRACSCGLYDANFFLPSHCVVVTFYLLVSHQVALVHWSEICSSLTRLRAFKTGPSRAGTEIGQDQTLSIYVHT